MPRRLRAAAAARRRGRAGGLRGGTPRRPAARARGPPRDAARSALLHPRLLLGAHLRHALPIDVLFLDEHREVIGERRARRARAGSSGSAARRPCVEFRGRRGADQPGQPVAQRAQRQLLGHVQLQRQPHLLAALGGLAQPARVAAVGRAGQPLRARRGPAPPPARPPPGRSGRAGASAASVEPQVEHLALRRGASRAWRCPRTGARSRCGRGPSARPPGASCASAATGVARLVAALLGALQQPLPRSAPAAGERGGQHRGPRPPAAPAPSSEASHRARSPLPSASRAHAAARDSLHALRPQQLRDPRGGQRVEAHQLAARHHRGQHLAAARR